MQKKIIPIKTADRKDDHSLPFSKRDNELYFPTDSVLKEKHDTFIKGSHLEAKIHALDKMGVFIIGEIGFGSALNFLLTWQCWEKKSKNTQQLHYISTESHPIKKLDLALILIHFPELSYYVNKLLASYPLLLQGCHRLHFDTVCLTLMIGEPTDSLKQFLSNTNVSLQKELQTFYIDCWYFNEPLDEENNLSISQDLLNTFPLLSHSKSTLTFSYLSKTLITLLEMTGYTYQKYTGVEKKKVFLSAHRMNGKPVQVITKGLKTAPWQCHKPVNTLDKDHSIAIIGAGLAGSIMAYRLAERGYKVTLYEKNTEVATQGSGNEIGMVHFKLSAFHSPLNDFMLSAYLYALRFYSSLDNVSIQEGIADLLSNEIWEKKQSQLNELAKHYPELIQFLTSDEISKIAEIPLSKKALYWPKALFLSPKNLCKTIIKHKNICLVNNTEIDVNTLAFDKVILCTGTSTNKIPGLTYLPLETVTGMVSYFSPTQQTSKLRIGLTDKGYVLPATYCNKHVMGGSYHVDNILLAHQAHLNCAINISPLFKPLGVPTHKWGERAKTYDYLPYVGPLPDFEKFKAHYASLSLDKNKDIPNAAPYHNNKFILTGFGSHGLTTIPLSVEILLCQLLNEPLPISLSQLQFLSPSRSIIKNIIRNK